MSSIDRSPRGELPVDVSDSRSVAWWGMLFLLLGHAIILVTFMSAYYYLGAGESTWPPEDIAKPERTRAAIGTVVIIATVVPAYWAASSIRKGNRSAVVAGLATCLLLGLVFLVIEGYEYGRQDFDLQTHAYASCFLAILALHAVLVIVALVLTLAVGAWTLLGYYNEERNLAIQNAALAWYATALSWVIVFAVLYVSPYVIDM